ncbi:MAG: hypothetical protein VKK98_06425 [Cyanobacteriota bacterium]|nr:hypothetical protein [Cyanobacteriota bacterium]
MTRAAVDLFAALPTTRSLAAIPDWGSSGHSGCSGTTAPEQVLAAELQARGQSSEALSMMVSSMVRMVQAGRERDSRWKAT